MFSPEKFRAEINALTGLVMKCDARVFITREIHQNINSPLIRPGEHRFVIAAHLRDGRQFTRAFPLDAHERVAKKAVSELTDFLLDNMPRETAPAPEAVAAS